MRLAPIAIFYRTAKTNELLRYAEMSSLTTHPGHDAVESCKLLAFLIARAIDREDDTMTMKHFLDVSMKAYDTVLSSSPSGPGVNKIRRLIRSAEPDDSTERNWNWKSTSLEICDTLKRRIDSRPDGTYNGYPVSRGYFGAYSVDGLAVALFSLYHTSTFNDAVERCVNFLGDADSTGAIVGQLAGAFYGSGAIDSRFVECMRRWDNGDVVIRAVLLHVLGERTREERVRR